VAENSRKRHSKELHKRYFSPNIVRMIKLEKDKMGGTCSAHGKMRNTYKL
jgi:hypothetical protein